MKPTDDNLSLVLQHLNSATTPIQEEAKRYALSLEPDRLLRLTQLEADNYRKKQRGFQSITYAALLASLAIGFALTLYRDPSGFPYAMTLLAGVCLSLVVVSTVLMPVRAHRSLYNILGALRDPRFIGPILTMLHPDTVTGSTEASTTGDYAKRRLTLALREILPQLKASDRLSREEMLGLLSLLHPPHSGNFHLVLSVLKALEQVGDEMAIPAVTALTSPRKPALIRRAASECLPYLLARAEQQRLERTLLRASQSASHAIPETLLRPVTPSNTPAEQLLRSNSLTGSHQE